MYIYIYILRTSNIPLYPGLNSWSILYFTLILPFYFAALPSQLGAWVGNGLLGRGMRHPQGAWRNRPPSKVPH